MTDRVKIKKTMWDEPTSKRAKELWAQGLSYAKIGEVIGTTRCAVAGFLKRQGLRRTQLYDPPGVRRVHKGHTRPERKKMEPTPIIPEPSSDTNVTLLEARRTDCRWPIDGTEEPTVCGAHADKGVYCSFHHARSYSPSQPRRDNERQLNWRSRI